MSGGISDGGRAGEGTVAPEGPVAEGPVTKGPAGEGQDLRPELDRLIALAARLCGASCGIVTLVEGDRHVVAASTGLDPAALPAPGVLCRRALEQTGGFELGDAAADPLCRDDPFAGQAPRARFFSGRPLSALEGAPFGSFCVLDPEARDGLRPDQSEALGTLAMAAAALLDRQRIRQSSRAFEQNARDELQDLEQRFHFLSDAMPHLVWAANAQGQVDYLNRGWNDFIGEPPEKSYDHGWIEFLHPDDRPVVAAAWQRAVESNHGYEVEYRLRRGDGEYRWFLARGLPMLDSAGRARRWIGTSTQIHEQKASTERMELLSRELNHRIKNIFAVIGGLIALTTRKSPELRELAAELQGRILALGRAHDFVRSDRRDELRLHARSSLKGMLRALIVPYQDDAAQRIVLKGDDIPIDDRSATPLALFFHELATNAAKYGALSNVNGTVTIAITQGETIEIVWSENDGPPIAAPPYSAE